MCGMLRQLRCFNSFMLLCVIKRSKQALVMALFYKGYFEIA